MIQTQNGTTTTTGVALDGIGEMIEDRNQYNTASALCLLSLAYSAERIAAALEAHNRMLTACLDGDRAIAVCDMGRSL